MVKKNIKNIKKTQKKISIEKKSVKQTLKKKAITKKAAVKKPAKTKNTPTAKKIIKKKVVAKAKKPVKKNIVAKKVKKLIKKSTAVKKSTKKPLIKKKVQKKTALKAKKTVKTPKKPIKIPQKPAIKKPQKIIAKKAVDIIKTTPKDPIKTAEKEHNFKAGDFAIYPSHGVGKILAIETFSLSDGTKITSLTIYFEKEKLIIKVPLEQINTIGLRPLVSKQQMDEVFAILKSGIKKLKGMWSRRAQEYESKINSGDIVLLAEVLRDLTRDIEDGDRSYSERIIYETAIYRLASEYAAIAAIDFETAKEKIISTAKNKLGLIAAAQEKLKNDDFDDFDAEDDDSDDEDSDDDDLDDSSDDDDDDDEDQ